MNAVSSVAIIETDIVILNAHDPLELARLLSHPAFDKRDSLVNCCHRRPPT